MKLKNRIILILAAAFAVSAAGCSGGNGKTTADLTEAYPEAHVLHLDGQHAALDGTPLKEYDYTWRADPELPEPEFSGTKPDETLRAYLAHDIIYYPEISEASFTKEEYDGEQEWVTSYTADGLQDYLFGTLPVLGAELPTEMMHTAEEAYRNPVVHITAPGTYVVEGSFDGQLFFDFGDEEETFANEAASVTVILNGADVTCTVAPAIVFHDVYECDNTWEDRESYTDQTELSDAGVKIILADGTENSFTGCNVYRLLKPEYKKNSTSVQKKLWKTDGAFYSFQSFSISGEANGTGILNVTGETFEGMDSELHLTVNGGYVNIYSQDDGINVNEDGVSVFTLNGGHLTVFAGLGAEGDVIDSNGFIRLNGGVLAGTSKSPSDALLDSDSGTFVSENAKLIAGGSVSSDRQPGNFNGMQPGHPEGMPGGMPEPPEGMPGGMPEPPEGMPGGMPEPPQGEMPKPTDG